MSTFGSGYFPKCSGIQFKQSCHFQSWEVENQRITQHCCCVTQSSGSQPFPLKNPLHMLMSGQAPPVQNHTNTNVSKHKNNC